MRSFKNAKVIILPTNEKVNIIEDRGKFELIKNAQKANTINSIVKGYHLYIISNDEIKEGDWVLDIVNNRVLKSDHIVDYEQNHVFKIIATTDTSLLIDTYINQGDTVKGDLIIKRGSDYTTGLKGRINLPQPSQQFIQKYIEEYNKGNVTTDVLVEYQTDFKFETKLYMLGIKFKYK